jgi:hypothetical protein
MLVEINSWSQMCHISEPVNFLQKELNSAGDEGAVWF